MLKTETDMFDKYFKRVEPKNIAGLQQSTLNAPQPMQSSHEMSTGRYGRKRSKSRSSAMDRMMRLTAEQKCDIAQKEIEEYREEIDKVRDDSERVLDTYKVSSTCHII